MSGQPISQEIQLPTDSDQVGAAVKKLDELIARVSKLESATSHHRKETEKHESAFKNLTHAFGQAVKGEVSMIAGFRGIGIAAGEAHKQTSEFLEFIGAMAAFEMLKKIGEKVVEIGEEAVRSAAKAERMNRVIDLAAGGGEAGERTRGWIERFSKTGEFSEAANESAYVRLKRVGIGQQQSGLIMKAAQDVAAVSENKDEAYQEAIAAFERIQVTGKVNARTLRPLGIGVQDLKTLSRFKGMNTRQLNQALEKSDFNQNELFALIMSRAHETKLGSRSADNVDLLSTKMEKLSELPELFYKRLATTGAARKLADEIGTIIEKLDPESPTGKKIFGALEQTFTAAADAVGSIDFDSIADTIRDDVVPAIRTMIGLIGPAVDAINTTVHGLGLAAHFLSGRKTGAELGAAQMSYQQNQAALAGPGALSRAWAFVKAPFLRSAAGLEGPSDSTIPAAAKRAGEAVGKGFAQGIQDSTGPGAEAGMSLGNEALSSLNESIEAKSPSRKAKRSGHFVGEGFALGIEGSAGRIADAMDSTISIPADGAGGFSTVAGGFGGMSLTVEAGAIQVSGAGSPSAVADEVIEKLKQSILVQLADALAQARVRRGA